LVSGVRESGLYMLLVDLMPLVHSNKKLDEIYSIEEVYEEHVWWDAMETISKPMKESIIDFRLANDRSVIENKDIVVGFFMCKGVDLEDTLTLWFS